MMMLSIEPGWTIPASASTEQWCSPSTAARSVASLSLSAIAACRSLCFSSRSLSRLNRLRSWTVAVAAPGRTSSSKDMARSCSLASRAKMVVGLDDG